MLVALTAHRAHWREGGVRAAHIIKQRDACAPVPVISGDVPVLRVSPPSLLYLSIIKLARFWGGRSGGRGPALFERRPFKSLQTNGTVPRSA